MDWSHSHKSCDIFSYTETSDIHTIDFLWTPDLCAAIQTFDIVPLNGSHAVSMLGNPGHFVFDRRHAKNNLANKQFHFSSLMPRSEDCYCFRWTLQVQ